MFWSPISVLTVQPDQTTRAILNAIHDGSLAQAEFAPSVFGLSIPSGGVSGVDDALLDPRIAWDDDVAYEKQSRTLAVSSRVLAEHRLLTSNSYRDSL